MVLATGSGDAKTTPPILLMLNRVEGGCGRSCPCPLGGWDGGRGMQHPPHRFLFPLKSIGFLPFGARSITVTLISSSDMRIARSGADAQLLRSRDESERETMGLIGRFWKRGKWGMIEHDPRDKGRRANARGRATGSA